MCVQPELALYVGTATRRGEAPSQLGFFLAIAHINKQAVFIMQGYVQGKV